MPLLEVKHLDKTFTGDNHTITAIDDLSLSIDEYEFVSIVGPSGCGKSTFLHILGALSPSPAARFASRVVLSQVPDLIAA